MSNQKKHKLKNLAIYITKKKIMCQNNKKIIMLIMS